MLSSLIKCVLGAIPYNNFLKIYPKLCKTKLVDFVNEVYSDRFFNSSELFLDTKNYLKNKEYTNKLCLIKSGTWEYQLANFCFVKDMLESIIWSVESGYIPVVDIYPKNSKYYSGDTRLWDMFFKQPKHNLMNTLQVSDKLVCPIKKTPIRAKFTDVQNPTMVEFWHNILDEFGVYNDEVQEYFDNEYNNLILGKSVVACVLRSTDYTKTKPKSHPIQPTLEEVFEKIHNVMDEFNVEYIYIATEDKLIADRFHEEFPNKVIENKRHYFNEKFDENNLERVSQVHFNRENDDYLKMLEYMSSINIVSKCDYLVTGLSGGSEMAIYRNGNRYKYSYIFDKGVY